MALAVIVTIILESIHYLFPSEIPICWTLIFNFSHFKTFLVGILIHILEAILKDEKQHAKKRGDSKKEMTDLYSDTI